MCIPSLFVRADGIAIPEPLRRAITQKHVIVIMLPNNFLQLFHSSPVATSTPAPLLSSHTV